MAAFADSLKHWRDSRIAEEKARPKPVMRVLGKSEMAKARGAGLMRMGDNAGKYPWQQFDGDVNATIGGNLHLQYTDASWSAPGLPMQFVRTYDSNSSEEGPFGIGWSHNHDSWIEVAPKGTYPDDTFVLRRKLANGGFESIEINADGTLSPAPYDSNHYSLPIYETTMAVTNPCECVPMRDASGSLVLRGPNHDIPVCSKAKARPISTILSLTITSEDGTVTVYGGPGGAAGGRAYIRSITDRFGNKMSYNYSCVAAEPFDDVNGNGRYDAKWESPYQDSNRNGRRDFDYETNPQPWIHRFSCSDEATSTFVEQGIDCWTKEGYGVGPAAEYSNGYWICRPEPFVDANANGQYDAGDPQNPTQNPPEEFWDYNGNGKWDGPVDTFTDLDSNGKWDDARLVLTRIRDTVGRELELSYSDPNFPTHVTAVAYKYDAAGNHRQVTYTYYGRSGDRGQWGNLHQTTDLSGFTTTYAYSPAQDIRAAVDAYHNGDPWPLEPSDTWGFVSDITGPDGKTTRYEYGVHDTLMTRCIGVLRRLTPNNGTYNLSTSPTVNGVYCNETKFISGEYNEFNVSYQYAEPNSNKLIGARLLTTSTARFPGEGWWSVHWDSCFGCAWTAIAAQTYDADYGVIVELGEEDHFPSDRDNWKFSKWTSYDGSYNPAFVAHYHGTVHVWNGSDSQSARSYEQSLAGEHLADQSEHKLITQIDFVRPVPNQTNPVKITEARYTSVDVSGEPTSYTGMMHSSNPASSFSDDPNAVPNSMGKQTWSRQYRGTTPQPINLVDQWNAYLPVQVQLDSDDYYRTAMTFYDDRGRAVVGYSASQIRRPNGTYALPANPYNPGSGEPVPSAKTWYWKLDDNGNFAVVSNGKLLDNHDSPTKIVDSRGATKYSWYNQYGDVTKTVETVSRGANPTFKQTDYQYADSIGTVAKVTTSLTTSIQGANPTVEKEVTYTRNANQQLTDVDTKTHIRNGSPLRHGVVHFDYDTAGRVASTTKTDDGVSHTQTVTYYPGGQVETSTFDGVATTYVYNEASLVRSIAYSVNQQSHKIRYDYYPSTSLIKTVTEASDGPTAADNDDVDYVKADYTYWNDGAVKTVTVSSPNPNYHADSGNGSYDLRKFLAHTKISYSYDDMDHLTNVTNTLMRNGINGNPYVDNYIATPNDFISYDYGDISASNRGYDGAGNRRHCVITQHEAFVDAGTRYDGSYNPGTPSTPGETLFDLNDNGEYNNSIYDNPPAQQVRTETYTYDADSRLTGVNYGDGTSAAYSYDLLTNISSMDYTGGSRTDMSSPVVDDTNKLNSAVWGSTTRNYKYDETGDGVDDSTNMTRTDLANGGYREMQWNAFDELKHVDMRDSGGTLLSSVDYTYDVGGLRTSKQISGQPKTHYVYVGQNLAAEYQEGSTVTKFYVNGSAGVAGAVTLDSSQTSGNPQYEFYFYDGLGNVIATVNDMSNVVGMTSNSSGVRSYDVYGAPRDGSALPAHGFVGSLGHVGDGECGLIYMRARYYDPDLGRFISEDPSRHGANLYAYCNGNPTNLTDADGKQADMAMATVGLVACMLAALLIAWDYDSGLGWAAAVPLFLGGVDLLWKAQGGLSQGGKEAKNTTAAIASLAIAGLRTVKSFAALNTFSWGCTSIVSMAVGAYMGDLAGWMHDALYGP